MRVSSNGLRRGRLPPVGYANDRAILSILYFLGSLAVGVVSAVYTSSRIDFSALLN